MSVQFLSYPGLPWLSVQHGVCKFEVQVSIRHAGYLDSFTMDESAIGVNGKNLLKEAYLRRAKLIVIEKIAKELEK
jgi:hypothetical protein